MESTNRKFHAVPTMEMPTKPSQATQSLDNLPEGTTPSVLRKFPLEIREIVYREALEDSWNGKTPALIIALRGDQGLYHEALKVFYATNTFAISARNRWLCDIYIPGSEGMEAKPGIASLNPLETVQKLSLRLPSIRNAIFNLNHDLANKVIKRCYSAYARMVNVTHLDITVEGFTQATNSHQFISCALYLFRGLEMIRFLVTQHCLYFEGLTIGHYIGKVSNALGLNARPASVASSGPMIWEWRPSGKKFHQNQLSLTVISWPHLRRLLHADQNATVSDMLRLRLEVKVREWRKFGDDEPIPSSCDELNELDMKKFFKEGNDEEFGPAKNFGSSATEKTATVGPTNSDASGSIDDNYQDDVQYDGDGEESAEDTGDEDQDDGGSVEAADDGSDGDSDDGNDGDSDDEKEVDCEEDADEGSGDSDEESEDPRESDSKDGEGEDDADKD